MVKQLQIKLMLLLCALVAGSNVWAEEVTVASGTFAKTTYTTGWNVTGTGTSTTGCVIIGKGESITSPTLDLSSYSEVTISISSRRYGSLSGSKATIDASIGGTSKGTTDATSTSVIALSNITFTPTASMTSVSIVFTCTNATSAGSTHGAGIGSITIKGTKPDGPVDLISFAFGTASDEVQLTKTSATTWEASYTQTVTVNPSAYTNYTYTIDNDASTVGENTFAGINSSTGVVTIVAGANETSTIVVKAVGSATSAYNKPSDATYTLNVTKADETIGTPVFSLATGTYYYGTTTEITSARAEKIYYTTDGTAPSKTNGTLYSSAIAIDKTMTLKAIGYDFDGVTTSTVASIDYTLKHPLAPTISPNGGEVKAGSTVTLTAGEGGDIVVYTTDGTTPTISSNIYVSPIVVSTGMTIKAATVDDGDNLGAIASATYTIKVSDDYVKVTDASSLRAGDQLILVYETGNLALGAINSGGKYYEDASVTISSNTISDPTDVAILTLGGSEGGWTLKSSLSNNYLSLTSSSNELKAATSVSGNTEKWTITISSGNVKIINVAYPQNSNKDRYIQWNDASTGQRFACYTGTQKDLQLYRLSKPVTISSAEYATYCGTSALNFDGVGIKAYTATDNETSVKLNEITSGKVPANTPVVLYKEGANGTAINVPVIASADAISGTNDLHVVDTGGLTGEDNIYVLAKKPTVGFYLWDKSQTLNAGKIYLQGKTLYGARSFIGFNDEEQTTGVADVWIKMSNVRGDIYNLNGQRVAQPTKGLYIVKGKKIMVK